MAPLSSFVTVKASLVADQLGSCGSIGDSVQSYKESRVQSAERQRGCVGFFSRVQNI